MAKEDLRIAELEMQMAELSLLMKAAKNCGNASSIDPNIASPIHPRS